VFRIWDPYVEILARSHVKLAPALRPALRAGFENRQDMVLYQRNGAWYKSLNALDGRGWRTWSASPRTPAFLLYVDELWPGGPGLVNAFGMDGVATEVWAYRLRRDFAYLLDAPVFAMVELEGGGIPERPFDLRWALDWKIEVAIEEPL